MGTFTTRLNLFKPSGTPGSADAVDVAADLNAQYDIIDTAMGFQPVSSFPGSPYTGKGVFRTDLANMPSVWDGGVWSKFGTILSAVKTADQSVNNSVTLVDATDLSVACVSPATYFMISYLQFTAAASNTPDLQLQFNYSGTFAGGWVPAGLGTAAGSDTDVMRMSHQAWNVSRAVGAVTTPDLAAIPHGILITSTAGTFKLRFAQQTATAENITLRQNSTMILI